MLHCKTTVFVEKCIVHWSVNIRINSNCEFPKIFCTFINFKNTFRLIFLQ